MSQTRNISRRRFFPYSGLVTGAAATFSLVRVSTAADQTAHAAAQPATL